MGHGLSAEVRVCPQLDGPWGWNLFPILGMWGGHQALGLSLNFGDTGWVLSAGLPSQLWGHGVGTEARFWPQLGTHGVGAEGFVPEFCEHEIGTEAGVCP